MLKNGNLKDFHVADLINIIGQSKKTGELKINHRDSQAVLFFLNGDLVDASHGSLNGEEIIYDVMTYESGEFDFNETQFSNEKSITKNIDDLINEGGLRIDLINSLRKNSLVSKPSSVIKPLSNFQKLNNLETEIYQKVNNYQAISIIELAKRCDLSIEDYTNTLKNLMEKNAISIQKSDEEMFWKSFQYIVNKLYTEFTSISGIKMTADLDKKIQDLIVTDTWNLTFKDGRIYTNELFNFPVEEQWKIYDKFLNNLFDYFTKVYGNDFVDKVLNNLSSENQLEVLLKKLGR